MGPEMPESGSKTSTVSVVRATFGVFSTRSKWFPVAIGDHGWIYDPETKQHSMEWRHCGLPRPPPKISECKNPLENFSRRFFGIKTVTSSLITFERAKLSTRSITHLCWCNWMAFWRENAAGRSPMGVLFIMDNAPAHRHLQPWRNLPTWASNVLITHPTLRIWPRWNTTCFLD